MRLYLIFLMGAVLVACGDPIKDNIDDLIAGGAGAEKAKMRLALAKKSAIVPLIAAFEQSSHSSRARVDMVEVLKRLYLREPDERILKALIAGLGDKDPAVRRKIAWACGDLRQRKTIPPLLDQLERDDDDAVRLEILMDLEIMGMRNTDGAFFDGEQNLVRRGKTRDQVVVQRFGKARVCRRHREPARRKFVRRRKTFAKPGAEREQRHRGAFAHDAPAPDLDRNAKG